MNHRLATIFLILYSYFMYGQDAVSVYEFNPILIDEKHKISDVNGIYKDTSSGYLWLSTADGLVKYNGSKFQKIDIPKVNSTFSVDKLGEDIVFSSSSGLGIVKDGTSTLYPLPNGTKLCAYVFHKDVTSGLIYILCNDGVYNFDGSVYSKVKSHSIPHKIHKNFIFDPSTDKLTLLNYANELNTLYDKYSFSKDRDIISLNGREIIKFNCSAEVTSIYEDGTELWIATNQGFYLFPDTSIENYYHLEDALKRIYSVGFIDSSLYVFSLIGDMRIFSDNEFLHHKDYDSKFSNTNFYIGGTSDTDSTYLAPTLNKGILKFSGQSVSNLDVPEQSYLEIFIKGNQTYYIGNSSLVIDSSGYRSILDFDDCNMYSMNYMYSSFDDKVVACNKKAAYEIKGNDVYPLPPEYAIYKEIIDSSGRRWTATSSGLKVTEQGTTKTVTSNLDYDVWDILETNDHIYFSYKYGFGLIDKNRDIYNQDLIQYSSYNNGFRCGETIQNCAILRDDQLWIPSYKGISKIDLKRRQEIKNIPVKITDFQFIDEDQKNIKQIITDNYRSLYRAFQISVNAIDLSNAKEGRILYILEGYDSDWLELDHKSNFIKYTQLDPGSYKLKLRYVNSNGNNSFDTNTISLKILPRFYERQEVQVVMILLAFFTMGWIIRKYFKNVTKQKLKEETEKNNLVKTMMELEIDNLNNQLNPHDIKGALNNVLGEVQMKAPDTYDYLVKFIGLMNDALYNKNLTDTLSNQLDQVQMLVDLQQTRFFEPLTLSVTNHIENDMQLPRLLLKNMVENSIKHGFTTIKGGHIEIIASIQDDFYIVKVIDNGRGFDSSGSKGKGISVYQKLFNILNLENQNNAYLEVKNIDNGTEAVIVIPRNYNF